MQPPFFDLLIASIHEVFETMLFLEVVPEETLGNDTVIDGMEITSIIALGGEISGMLAIHATREFAMECACSISGEDAVASDDPVVLDTMGEIANMIAGSFKRNTSSHINLFEISLPCIITSASHSLHYHGSKEKFPRVIIPFVVDGKKRFCVELLYHKS